MDSVSSVRRDQTNWDVVLLPLVLSYSWEIKLLDISVKSKYMFFAMFLKTAFPFYSFHFSWLFVIVGKVLVKEELQQSWYGGQYKLTKLTGWQDQLLCCDISCKVNCVMSDNIYAMSRNIYFCLWVDISPMCILVKIGRMKEVLLCWIPQRKIWWICHILRHDDLLPTVLEGHVVFRTRERWWNQMLDDLMGGGTYKEIKRLAIGTGTISLMNRRILGTGLSSVVLDAVSQLLICIMSNINECIWKLHLLRHGYYVVLLLLIICVVFWCWVGRDYREQRDSVQVWQAHSSAEVFHTCCAG